MVSIFISRKTSDLNLAKKFKEIVEWSFEGVKVDMAEEMPHSLEPTAEIIKRVRGCDWFVLLWTDRFENWTWPVFETGIHFGRPSTKLDEKTFFYVLHHPQDLPDSPLHFWKRVPVDDDNLNRFLVALHQKGRRLQKERTLDFVLKDAPRLAELKQAIFERYSDVWLEKKHLARDILLRFNRQELLQRKDHGFPSSTKIMLEGESCWRPLVPSQSYLSVAEFESSYPGLRITKSWQHCVCEGVIDVTEPGEDLTLGLPLLRLQKGAFDEDNAILLRGSIRRVCATATELRVRVCFSETPCYLQMNRDELVAQLIRLLETLWQMKSTCFRVIDQYCSQLTKRSEPSVSTSRMIRLLHSSVQNARAELAARGYDRTLVQSSLDDDQFMQFREIAIRFRKLFEKWDNITEQLEQLRFLDTSGLQPTMAQVRQTNEELLCLTRELSERISDALHLSISQAPPCGGVESAQESPKPGRFWNWLIGR